jgi:cytochrome b561
MPNPAEGARYRPTSIALHWLMLVLIVGAYATMELRGYFPKGSDAREAMKAAHYSIGLSVFVLVWLRVMLRLLTPAARDRAQSGAAKLAAAAVHVGHYALMIGLPLLGWAILSAEGKPVPFFAWELPPLLAPSESRAEIFEELHEAGATAGYALVALHAAAALAHHYLLRDDVLRRMLPRRA